MTILVKEKIRRSFHQKLTQDQLGENILMARQVESFISLANAVNPLFAAKFFDAFDQKLLSKNL
jgi:hypothetical protein